MNRLITQGSEATSVVTTLSYSTCPLWKVDQRCASPHLLFFTFPTTTSPSRRKEQQEADSLCCKNCQFLPVDPGQELGLLSDFWKNTLAVLFTKDQWLLLKSLFPHGEFERWPLKTPAKDQMLCVYLDPKIIPEFYCVCAFKRHHLLEMKEVKEQLI